MTIPAARVSGVSKHFGSIRALADVNFDVLSGEVHALVGENGAGKSTLVRILGGVHRPDQGEIAVDGHVCHFDGPRDAIAAGIVTIPQELRLVSTMSIAENITLDDAPLWRVPGLRVIDRVRMRKEALEQLAQLDFAPDPDVRIDRLSFGERQLVAIARALRRRCRILILDEPTAALEAREIERLFAVLTRMRSNGTAIIYVSHRLDEVVTLGDRCTVLRDGQTAAVSTRGAFKVADLVEAMTGRGITNPETPTSAPGPVLLEAVAARPSAIQIRANEVIGLAGLLGSGASDVLHRIFGVAREKIEIRRNGIPQRISNPPDAVRNGIGLVPDERRLGLVMKLSIRDNIVLPSLGVLARSGRLERSKIDRLVKHMMEMLDIRPRQAHLPVSALSGGNQQKVILAKWLARDVAMLLLDEPTQGIDIAAKQQIHTLIRDFATRGGGVLVRSSELAELALLCDSILALHKGIITDRLARSDGFDEKRLHTAIAG